MRDKIEFKWHTVSLVAMFVLGDAVIFLPTANANEFTFAAFLVSGACLAAVFLLSAVLIGGVVKLKAKDKLIKRLAGIFLLACAAVFALFCAAKTFLVATDFVGRTILPQTAKWLIIAIFSGTLLYFVLKRREHLLKFSLLSIVVILAVVIFFVIAAMDQYDIRNMYIFKIPSFRQLGTQMIPYLVHMVLPAVILPIYLYFTFYEARTSVGTVGVVFGTALLGLCILSPVLLFGPTLAGSLDYPFSSAVSTVTVGRLFTRLDGFSYFVYFVCSLVKIIVCLSVVFSCLKKVSQLFGGRYG